MTPLGTAPKNWNNKLIMFTGDTVRNQGPQSVFLPPLLFATVPTGIKVLLLQAQVLKLFAKESLETLDIVEDNMPKGHYKFIKTCHGMYLPANLIPLFLGWRLMPHQALLTIH